MNARMLRAVLIAVLAATAVGVAACGGNSPSQQLQTYSNAKYGFSLQYDAQRFSIGDENSARTGGLTTKGLPSYQIGVFDVGQAKAGGFAPGVVVNVMQLPFAPSEQDAVLRRAVQGTIKPLRKAWPAATISDPRRAQLNGSTAWTYDMNGRSPEGVDLSVRIYQLIFGRYMYRVALQCPPGDVETLMPALEKVAATLRLLPTPPPSPVEELRGYVAQMEPLLKLTHKLDRQSWRIAAAAKGLAWPINGRWKSLASAWKAWSRAADALAVEYALITPPNGLEKAHTGSVEAHRRWADSATLASTFYRTGDNSGESRESSLMRRGNTSFNDWVFATQVLARKLAVKLPRALREVSTF